MQTNDGRRRSVPRAPALAAAGVAGLIAVLALGAGAARTHNRLVSGSEAVDAAWAQVETVVQRRADLVPGLQAVAAAHATHERSLLTAVTEARDAYQRSRGPDRVTQARELDRALAAARVTLAAQPGIGSSAAWSRLRREIVGSENRIAIERRRYNHAVRRQRTRIRTFPGRILAPVLGLNDPPEY